MDYTDILSDIRKILRAVKMESKRIEKEFDVSIPQLLALIHLNKCKDYQSTHKELADKLNLNSSTLTGIINRLEKKNFVARLPKKGDKRVSYVTLTSNGVKLLDKSPNLLQDRFIRKLNEATEKEIVQIKNSLDILIEFLGIQEVASSPFLSIDENLYD